MLNQITTVFEDTARHLTDLNLPSHHYVIEGYSGYQSITGQPQTDVYCLEACLGPAHEKPGYMAYAVAQVFDPAHPNMALLLMVERQDGTGALHHTAPTYNRHIDRAFSYCFLPTMHTAFNILDPSGQQKGLLVQSYNARITWGDLVPASKATVLLMKRFKRDGQIAQIAVDFEDPLTTFIARLVKPLTVNADVHYLPRTAALSSIQIPLKNPDGSLCLVGNNSTALDQGFDIARQYLAQYRPAAAALPDLQQAFQ
jgi:hypothetical protein